MANLKYSNGSKRQNEESPVVARGIAQESEVVERVPPPISNGDIVVGDHDEVIIRQVQTIQTERAATSIAQHASRMLRAGYDLRHVIPTCPGEALLYFQIVRQYAKLF